MFSSIRIGDFLLLMDIIMKTKVCTKCKEEKELSDFGKDKCICKECLKKYYKNYKEKYPEKIILNSIIQRCKSDETYVDKKIKNYLTLKDIKFLMKRDNYYKLKNPSIDRKKNDKHYTLENCRFIEMNENAVKDKRKCILQFDLNNIFIQKFKSAKEASRKLNINQGSISHCANKLRNYAGSFIWKYENE